MRLAVPALVLACAACDDPGLTGPLPGGDTPCTQRIVVDGGGPALEFPSMNVVAAADLTATADGSYAAAVERWDGVAWKVGVVWTDPMHPPMEVDLGAPPAGTTPPAAAPRMALSPSGEAAIVWHEPDGTLAMATRAARTPIAGSTHAIDPSIAWADASTPAVVWISENQRDLVSTLGSIATWPRWAQAAAAPAAGGGVLVAAMAPTRIVFFKQLPGGAPPTAIRDISISGYLEGTMHLAHGAPQIYFVGLIPKLAKEQSYTLSATPGAIPHPVAAPDGPLESMVAIGSTWLLVGETGADHILDTLALGTPPEPATLITDGPNVFVAQEEPMVMIADGQVALAVVRDGRLEVDFWDAVKVCE